MTTLAQRIKQKQDLRYIETLITYYDESIAQLKDRRQQYLDCGWLNLDGVYLSTLRMQMRDARRSLAFYEQMKTHALYQIVYYT